MTLPINTVKTYIDKWIRSEPKEQKQMEPDWFFPNREHHNAEMVEEVIQERKT